LKSIVFIAALVAAWFVYSRINAPITYPPGILLAGEPEQHDPPYDVAFDYKKFQLKPMAAFVLDARVLHRKIYRYDPGAALVPVDVAVGWGPMSDQAVLDRLSVSQSARFYFYEYKGQPPIPKEEITSHSTNLHLIPSTAAIAALCKSLRTGELIHLSGLLVQATGPGIGTWTSSTSRTDSGNGACELVWVEDIEEIVR
jgi:hypothetical protein